MMRQLFRHGWLGLLGLAWTLAPTNAFAWGQPIPINVDSVFVWRFDVKCGPSAFAVPAGPWYSCFPVDPNLVAQPAQAAFPNWPGQFPPAPQLMPRTPAAPINNAGYDLTPGVRPTSFYTP